MSLLVTPAQAAQKITVNNVDEFFNALGSDRTIVLSSGEFDLSKAKGYGKTAGQCYSWYDVFDGYELQIKGVHNLQIMGQGQSKTRIVNQPRHANVLYFSDCKNIEIINLTAGHTAAPGACEGGVLKFIDSQNLVIDNCTLYGCGTYGVEAYNCQRLLVNRTNIKECTYGALTISRCNNVRFNNGAVFDCGRKNVEYCCFVLFEFNNSENCSVVNSNICNNRTNIVVQSVNSDLSVLGCRIDKNECTNGIFRILQKDIVVENCSLIDNDANDWFFKYTQDKTANIVDQAGRKLNLSDLSRMEYKAHTGPVIEKKEPKVHKIFGKKNSKGITEYHVQNVDDLLQAISSNSIIYLSSGNFELSKAKNYARNGQYYSWEDIGHEFTLKIHGIKNCSIIGKGKDKTTISTSDRYADVLNFANCENVAVRNITAGHIPNVPSSCAGDVLVFNNCKNILVDKCAIFGCGVNGIKFISCPQAKVYGCEIYQCMENGIMLHNSPGDFDYKDCNIHDCGNKDVMTSRY